MNFMEKKFNTKDCFSGELLTSYIYGELSEPATAQVESHLLGCSDCQTAFSSLSEARLSVFEWNKFEFLPMATPEINIVYKDQRSWIRRVWESSVVPHRWAAGAASFASIAIVLSIAFVFLNGVVDKKEIAAANKTVIAPKPQTQVQEPKAVPVAIPIDQNIESPSREKSGGSEIVNISARSAESPRRPQKHESKTTSLRQPTVPQNTTLGVNAPVRLSDLEELEDNSPRLSDLFDETEAS